jgi:hypothetical protein
MIYSITASEFFGDDERPQVKVTGTDYSVVLPEKDSK